MTKRKLSLIVYSMAVVWMIATAHAIQAQVLYGSIVGNIKDASDAAVAGATVALTSVETKQSRETTTKEDGGYSFPTVLPGAYDLKVAKAGFSTATETGIVAVANDIVRVNVTLRVGAVNEAVTVTAAASALQTDRADVHAELNSTQLGSLPMSNGRNYQTLFVTLPGFAGIQSSYNSTPSNPSKALV